jgi:hypothetical protein
MTKTEDEETNERKSLPITMISLQEGWRPLQRHRLYSRLNCRSVKEAAKASHSGRKLMHVYHLTKRKSGRRLS